MRGFTLLELLLSVAAIAIITSITMPVFYGFQTRHDLDIAAESLATSLRRAQVLAQGMNGDSAWGVRAAIGSVTLFRGASFAARDAAADEFFFMPDTISPSGIQEFIFEKFTGFPAATGTTTLTSSVSSEARDIGVNAGGMVSY